jgi:5-methylcytosine-specific restriction endonuclease McrA
MAMSEQEKIAKRRAYYAANKERLKEKSRQWREDNREKHRAYTKAYAAKHPEEKKASDKAYREATVEQRKEYQAEWKKNNPGRKEAIHKAYYAVNADKLRASSRQWAKDNPVAARERASRRRSQIAGVHVVKYADVEVFDRDDWYCQACGVKTSRDGDSGTNPRYANKDHIVPIVKGGHDALYNLQTLCKRCNSSKGPKDNDEFMKGFC